MDGCNLVTCDRGTVLYISFPAGQVSKPEKLAVLAIGLIILAPILRDHAPNYMVAYLYPLHRADSLMLGVFLALVWQWDRGNEFLHRHVKLLTGSCILLFLAIAYLSYRETSIGSIWGHFWLAVFYFNFLILALIRTDGEGKFHLFNNKVLEWLGLRSYGIYLFHKPVQLLSPLLIARFLTDYLPKLSLILIYTVVLFTVCELSYRYLEKPIMIWGHRFKYDPVEKKPDEVVQPQPV
jgi:peptidoglycan/LPS O-acetylase OafA/YrhL